MSLSDFSPKAAVALAAHVLGRDPTRDEIIRLLEVAVEVLTAQEIEKIVEISAQAEEVLDEPLELREHMEAIAALIARRWLAVTLGINALDGEQKTNALKAIHTHVTAHTYNHYRVARILRIA